MGNTINILDGINLSQLIVTGITTVAAGSTAAPSITPTGDSNTGIFFPAADTIAFGEGGSEAARIDSSGRFGLGTTTPGRKLVVAGDLNTVVAVEGSTSGTSNLFLGDTADEDVCALGYNHQTNSLGITVNASASPAVTIDSSGRLLVGTSSALTNVRIKGIITSPQATTPQQQFAFASNNYNAGLSITNYTADAYGAALSLNSSASNTLGTNTAVINNTGVGVISFNGNDGTNFIPCAQIVGEIDGTPGANDMPGRLIFSTTADGASSPTERFRLSQNGSVRVPGFYDFATASAANVNIDSDYIVRRSTSSIKYKKDVETIETAYSESLLACRPVWYRSKCEADNPNWGWWGFIAEEVAAIDPRLVHWKTTESVINEDGILVDVSCSPEPEGVQYDRFVPHLLNLIKRQKEQIEAQSTAIAALEARLTALEQS